ncbi:MAG: hypothetical protein GEV10_21670 [Streptosporangiales bacterium]|nr:hypothetical protein [Streptosporangiales bacterium]
MSPRELEGAVTEHWRATTERGLRDALRTSTAKVVVIDDDPTGTQPVHGVPVVTRWGVDDLVWALSQDGRLVFVSTNSRSMGADVASEVVREVARSSYAAADQLGVDVTFVSRGDSTLRGHVWDEVRAVIGVADDHGARMSGVVLVPAYVEAGRVTVDAEHCILDGRELTPLSGTEYARDATFGYATSWLPGFVAEKSRGAVASDDVRRIDLDLLRSDDLEGVREVLRGADAQPGSRPWVVADAVDYADLFRLSTALLDLEREGRRFVCRTGPSFVRAFGGVVGSPTLDDAAAARVGAAGRGGLVVVGSHVGLSSRQLEHLRRTFGHPLVELDVQRLLAEEDDHVAVVADRLADALRQGSAVLATSRRLVTGADGDDSLRISRVVARALVTVVQRVIETAAPAYLVAKGGITSSTLFSEALGASRALVLGSLLPGMVSVWSPVDGRRPGLPYVVFAGNVGTDTSLAEVVGRLEGSDRKVGP